METGSNRLEWIETAVFPAGDGTPPYFRIPALLVSRTGTVLAFCEKRINPVPHNGDHAENDILLRRSADGGRTWDPEQLVATDGHNSLNNPTVVEVPETGRLILMYQRYPRDFHVAQVEPGYDGPRICRTFLRTSDDDGAAWSDPREITRAVKRSAEVRATLCGPGIAVRLRRGPRRGRIVFPFYEGPGPYRVYAVYSDDRGETWHCGAPAAGADPTAGGGNENQVVELADGTLLLNSRRSGPGPKCRKTTVSRDAGETWSALTVESALPEPACQASILRLSDPLDDRRSRIIFSNPASEKDRVNGTVRLSYDEARTWPVARAVPADGFFCYSCLAALPDGRIGLLYEHTPDKNRPITIMFASFTLGWLTNGRDTGD